MKSVVLWVMSGFSDHVSEVSHVIRVMSGCCEPVSEVSRIMGDEWIL